MNRRDDDMMEAEAATPPSQAVVLRADPNDVMNMLAMARQLLDQGKPSQALQLVMNALRMQGGEGAVSRALEMHINRAQTNAATDQLASLFSECVIAEATPSLPGPSPQVIEPDPHGTSILAETGRKQEMLDASSDGSSFVCSQCGGLVSNLRKEEHYAFWCRKS